MQTDQLFINNNEIELSAGTVISLTPQINDLASLSDRQASFSNQFKIPKTANNIRALEWSDMIQSITNLPYRKLPAVVVKEGRQVIPKGFAIIESADQYFNVTVYSGPLSFFEIIEGRKLADLDLSAYNHDQNFTSVFGSVANTVGYKYPIIDYGQLVNTNRSVDIYKLRVAWFVHTLIDQIFTDSGFKKGGPFFNDTNYKKLLIPFTEDAPFWLAKITVTIFYDEIQSWFDSTIKLIREDRYGNIEEISSDFMSAGLGGGGSSLNNVFQVIKTDVKLYEGDKIYILYVTAGVNFGQVDMKRGGGADPFTELKIEFPDTTKNISVGLSTTYSVFGQNLIGAVIPFDDEAAPFFDSPGSYDNALYQNVTPALIAQLHVPDLTQKDLIKTVANQFALFFARDCFTNTIYAARMNDIEANIPHAINWSDKLHDDRSTWKLDFRMNNYARKNLLKYKDDSNDKDITKDLGDGFFVVDDETLKPEATLIELPFSATQNTKQLQDLNVPIIRKINDDGEYKNDVETRMLIDDTQDITGAGITFQDIGGSSTTTTDIPLAYFQITGKDFNLGFDDSLIPDYYDSLIKVLRKLKGFTGLFKLSGNDIAQLETVDPNTGLPYWFTPRYIWQLSSYFYINKIENYIGSDKLTKVQLIKLGGGDVVITEIAAVQIYALIPEVPVTVSQADFFGNPAGLTQNTNSFLFYKVGTMVTLTIPDPYLGHTPGNDGGGICFYVRVTHSAGVDSFFQSNTNSITFEIKKDSLYYVSIGYNIMTPNGNVYAPIYGVITPPINNGDTGSIDMVAYGGTVLADYTFLWNDASTLSVLANVGPGTYTCEITYIGTNPPAGWPFAVTETPVTLTFVVPTSIKKP